MYQTDTLKKMKVSELDKYLHHHNLYKKMLKKQKVQLISAHIAQKICNDIIENANQNANSSNQDSEQSSSDSHGSDESDDNESDMTDSEDTIMLEFGCDDYETQVEEEVHHTTVNRYGRTVGSWKSRFVTQ